MLDEFSKRQLKILIWIKYFFLDKFCECDDFSEWVTFWTIYWEVQFMTKVNVVFGDTGINLFNYLFN